MREAVVRLLWQITHGIAKDGARCSLRVDGDWETRNGAVGDVINESSGGEVDLEDAGKTRFAVMRHGLRVNTELYWCKGDFY